MSRENFKEIKIWSLHSVKVLGSGLYLHHTYVPLLIDPYSGKASCFRLYCTLYARQRPRPWALPELVLGFAPPHTCPYSGLGIVPYTDNFITRIWEHIGFLVRREILQKGVM